MAKTMTDESREELIIVERNMKLDSQDKGQSRK